MLIGRFKRRFFLFRAERYIIKDEEIRTFYGYFLGDDGTTFNYDLVYNFAMDTQNGQHYIKNLRFGAIESMVAARNNPPTFKSITCSEISRWYPYQENEWVGNWR